MDKHSLFDRIFRKNKIAREEAQKPKIGDIYYEEQEYGTGGPDLRMTCVRRIRYKIVDIQEEKITLVNIDSGEYTECSESCLWRYRKGSQIDLLSPKEREELFAKALKQLNDK